VPVDHSLDRELLVAMGDCALDDSHVLLVAEFHSDARVSARIDAFDVPFSRTVSTERRKEDVVELPRKGVVESVRVDPFGCKQLYKHITLGGEANAVESD